MAVAFQKTGFQSTGFQETSTGPVTAAFQSNAFQSTSGNVAFQTSVSAPTTTPHVGGGAGVVIGYSRKRLREIVEELLARRRALEAKKDKPEVVKEAIAAATEAIEAAELAPEPEALERSLERLNKTLAAIAETKKRVETVRHAVTLAKIRESIRAEYEAQNDEEEAIMLLLH